jgi:hercynylcysteine S-oxide lyase
VHNATIGFDTILRNLVFKSGDVIVYFNTIYGPFENIAQYLIETTPVELQKIEFTHPVSDQYNCDAFEVTIKNLLAKSKNPKLAIFDTINSTPGVRMPLERLTKLCYSYNILSCIDGAHGAGHIPLDLQTLNQISW